ncbi:MAG: protein disulfide oxidoreductase [Candidatus Thiodiazotropha sp.]
MDKQETKPSPSLARRMLRWGAELSGVLLVLFLVHLWQTRDLVVGDAPSLVGQTLAGEHFDLSGLGEGPVLIHFWASWCPVCGLEASSIDDLSRSHPVITVAMQSGSEQEVREHLQSRNLGFSTINDADGRIAAAWRVKGLPTSYIVDKDLKIRFVTVGYTPELTLRLRLWLSEHS